MRILLLLMAALSQVTACTKTQNIPWSEAMAVWFGNAAAQPTDPPHKHWTRTEEDLFLKRVGYADLALVGVVTSVGTFSRYEDPRQVTLTFKPTYVFHGDVEKRQDPRGELVLKLGDVALDFRRALQVQSFLRGKRYLLLLKEKPRISSHQRAKTGWKASLWRPPPKPKPIYRWALYRPEPKLLKQVRNLYLLLKQKKK
ncbi:MAG: hypothetical protein KAI47_01990 [Deltaproteobacteria bacterium]|nr:hypothetical protein [Deltaproteobacteria bacterium]